ncbi:MAG: HPP family protein [Rhodocyclaceae bacterium]|nr:HPP family protein [Rhodocyclaceae bacterium]
MRSLREFARRYLLADAAPLSSAERLRSAGGALAGMLIVEAILAVLPAAPATRALLMPLGATTVILYALPHSPLGQPWSLAGGYLLAGAIGLACGAWIALPWLAAACAVAAAIFAMALLRCIHPPAGALALTFALLRPSVDAALVQVLLNVAAMLAAVICVNNLLPGRRYPLAAPPPGRPQPPPDRSGIRHEDLQFALASMDSYLDVSEEDLVEVYRLATESAFRRHKTLACGDVMQPAPATLEFATELNAAWAMLRDTRAPVLPVLDRARRLIGLISPENFVAHVAPVPARSVGDNLRALLRPTPGMYSDKPEVAGQIMSPAPAPVRADEAFGSAAARLARGTESVIPVVDGAGRYLGLITPPMLAAVLYRTLALDSALGKLEPNS